MKKKTSEQKEKITKFKQEDTDLLKSGLHFGHSKSRRHPSMNPYIFGMRNNILIIDLEKIKKGITDATDFLKKLTQEKKTILFVSTKPTFKEMLRSFAREIKAPYITDRWIGGLLTNFEIIRKRINYFIELEQKKAAGELKKYPKKEQGQFEKEIARLEKIFGGIKNMRSLPDALFLLDVPGHEMAIREAKTMKLPVAAICDVDADIRRIDYPLPANDDSLTSVAYVLKKIKEALLEEKNQKENEV